MIPAVQTKDGVLMIGGVSVTEIAAKCGTPLYIYDESVLENQLLAFKEAFAGYGFHTQVIYASKAFNCLAMLKLVDQLGLGVDVVSGGELYTAMQAGFNMNKVYFHGNNKSPMEIQMALEAGVGTIILDNAMEADALIAQASAFGRQKLKVLLRVNPGIEAHTHKYIQTAYVDSKFGISIQKMKEITAIARNIDASENIVFAGFHAHIGSQIFEKEAFVSEIQVLSRFIADFEAACGIQITDLDLGGGFAAWYTEADHPIDIHEICQLILATAARMKEEYGLSVENLYIEPGRSIVGNAGYQLYTIGNLKETQNRKYIFIDGGMSDNIRPALYQAAYSADIATNMDAAKDQKVTIAGKCCESGDILGEDFWLQPYRSGDLLVVYTTGAYGYSMASNYNKNPVPGVIFVKDGQMRWVIRPQSYEHMTANECDERIL